MVNVNVERLFSWLEAESDFKMDYKLLYFLKSRYGKNVENWDVQPHDFGDVVNVKLLREKYEQKCISLRYSFDLSKRRYANIAGEYEKLIGYMEQSIATAKQAK